MDEDSNNSNIKTRINLSRITPVALVVGAAGFLGSSLTDALLGKGIQVIGVDDFSKGGRENLEEAIKHKNFHLVDCDASGLNLDLQRLDYIFITASGFNLDKILKIFEQNKSRCLFVSWIDLYEHKSEVLHWFRLSEEKLAKFASKSNLNARILRLGPIFGPRMNFETLDPLISLIHASLTERIQKEVALDFSSRALYVDDATDLIIKSVLAGATAQKIFDGVLPTPIKVAEVKQILLDPIWYEERGFKPTELPPWPTPNLEKTQKFLNWKPRVGIIEALRKTLSYFKDHEIKIIDVEESREALKEEPSLNIWQEEKKKQLEAFKEIPRKDIPKKRRGGWFSKLYILIATPLIIGGLVYPLFAFVLGIVTYNLKLQEASDYLMKGDFENSRDTLIQAKSGVEEARSIFGSLEILRNANFLKENLNLTDQLLTVASESVDSIQSVASGIENLYLGLKAVTGETKDDPFNFFSNGRVELEAASHRLQSAQAVLESRELPKQAQVLKEYLEDFNKVTEKARILGIILPKIISSDANYLVLLQNNAELRPTGGVIISYGLISFENGKLKPFQFYDVSSVDQKLKIHVEPPKEIKEDLGKEDWLLRDSNFESDFPTSAKQAEWFFNQEAGVTVSGVIVLDVTAMEDLMEVLGPIELKDSKDKVTSLNLAEKALTQKEIFLTSAVNRLFNKIFFLPNQNWSAVVQVLGKSLEEKHISIFLNDPKLLSYLVSQNWSGILPRAQDPKSGIFLDFLSPVEANFGLNQTNYFLKRSYEIETVVSKDGGIKHRLKINFANLSSTEVFPGGKYKNRFRIYLPFGVKLNRALWGETDITKDVSVFVDYGRSAYSMLLELSPKGQKALILDYEVPGKLEFVDRKAVYRIDIIKQAGTLKDPLEWKITYPIDYQVVSEKTQVIGPQEQKIVTDLSIDRSFEVEFSK